MKGGAKILNKRRVMIIFFIALLVFVNGLARWRPIETAVLSPLVLINVVVPDGQWRPLDWLTRKPVREEHQFVSSSGREMAADLYLPRDLTPDQQPLPAFIVHVPFAGGGLRDPRLVNIGQTFARAGYAVFIPFRMEEAGGILTEDDILDVISSFHYLTRHPQIDPSRIGLFGISYGNGPVFLAAANAALKDKVKFIVSFAGYFELKNAMYYVVSSRYSYKEIEEEFPPEQWVKDILRDNLRQRGIAESVIERLFSEPENFDAIVAAIPGFEKSLHEFSPASVVDQLDVPVLVTHATQDPTIPYTESMRLTDAFKGRVPTSFALTKIFIHGNIRPINLKTLRENYIPSLRDSLVFLYQLLSYRWR